MRALGRRCIPIQKEVSNKKAYLSAYCVGGRIKDLNAENMIVALKFETTALDYLSLKGIQIERVDTHSLRYIWRS